MNYHSLSDFRVAHGPQLDQVINDRLDLVFGGDLLHGYDHRESSNQLFAPGFLLE